MLLISENHKVIEIIVHGTGDIDRLYHSPHGVFLRRDGGVQKLGVAEIQEWSVQVSYPYSFCSIHVYKAADKTLWHLATHDEYTL